MTQCPHCQDGERQVKAGRNRGGSQRYVCRGCGRTYTPEPKPPGHEEALRREALELYAGNSSLRRIALALGISPQSVFNWVEAALTDAAAEETDELVMYVRARRELETQERQRKTGDIKRRKRGRSYRRWF